MNTCLYCGDGVANNKKFCDQSHAAKYNNSKRGNPNQLRCVSCGTILSAYDVSCSDGYCSVECLFDREVKQTQIEYDYTSMSSKQKGDIGEYTVVVEALRRGYTVCTTVGDNARYDIVIDTGLSLDRVQVKAICDSDGDSFTVPFTTNSYDSETGLLGTLVYTYTSADIDYILAVTINDGMIYKIPSTYVDGVTRAITLRKVPTSNNQRKKINWAHRFRW